MTEQLPPVFRSSVPVVGPLVTTARRLLRRLLGPDLRYLADQTTNGLDRHQLQVDAQSAQVNALASRSDARINAESEARERAQRDIQSLSNRLDEMDARLASLQLGPRLARLERARQQTPLTEPPQTPLSSTQPVRPDARPSRGGFDYLAFEARFRGDEESIRERQRIYLEVLAGRRRVVDLGCGRGELVGLLVDAGVPAYGVEVEPDFVDLLRERGQEVVHEDLFEHLSTLEPGTVDGIVASHVVEHLPLEMLIQFVRMAYDQLSAGGILVMETPNPESLLAGSVNFHRDPTHVRPIHPDTLGFIAESTGFEKVEVRRLSPFPPEEQLPVMSAEDDATETNHINRLATRLNTLLYGYQDYAIVASRDAS